MIRITVRHCDGAVLKVQRVTFRRLYSQDMAELPLSMWLLDFLGFPHTKDVKTA